MQTTLNKIRAHNPCANGYKKLLRHLGKTEADDAPLPIVEILNSNGLDDALWCLRAVDGEDKKIRLYAVWCARQVQHLATDSRNLTALDVAERYAHGQATKTELVDAADAAWAAVDAARAAVITDAADAAVDAADVAWAAARAAEWAAPRAAADAAWAAARAAARAAVITDAADAAVNTARDAVRAEQADRLREICA